MIDVIDEIDALIDEQLEAGEPIGGYDFGDPDYPRCPHCERDWHGLAITERMERMRYRGAVDADYRYSEDDSRVICPGSEFIGPPLGPRIPESGYDDGNVLSLAAVRALSEGFVHAVREARESILAAAIREVAEEYADSPCLAGRALTDGDRVAYEIRGQVVTGTVSNHQTHGNTTTFDFTPDRSE